MGCAGPFGMNMNLVQKGLLLRGLVACALALFVFFTPDLALPMVLTGVGAFFVVDGALVAFVALTTRYVAPMWPLCARGLLGALLGCGFLSAALFSSGDFVRTFSVFAVLGGLMDLVLSTRLKGILFAARYWRWMGVGAVLLGVFLALAETPGKKLLAFASAVYAAALGISTLLYGMHVRKLDKGT